MRKKWDNEFEKYNIDVISRSTFLKGIIPSDIDSIPTELDGIIPYKLKLIEISEEIGVEVAELATLFVYYNNNISSTILFNFTNSFLSLDLNNSSNLDILPPLFCLILVIIFYYTINFIITVHEKE